MPKGKIASINHFLFRDLQTFSSVTYLLMVITGMLFKNFKYQEFGINIFNYADIFDFLIAPFEDIRIMVFTIVAMIIPTFIMFIDDLAVKYPEKYGKIGLMWKRGKPMSNRAKNVLFITFYLMFIVIASKIYGQYNYGKAQSLPQVTLHFTDNKVMQGQLLGKTKEVLFIIDQQNVKVIPFTVSVQRMEFEIKE